MGAPTPAKFLRRGRPTDVGTVVVCAGDSITEGRHSASWVRLLDQDLAPRGYRLVNAGWSGYLSCSLLRELDSVIACRPDVVTVMIGTNDVMATTSEAWRGSYDRQEPPAPPTIDTYRAWLDEIVRRIAAETSARVALIEIPPISEDLAGLHNQRVDAFNEVLRTVAAARGVPVLPLNVRLSALIEASPPAPPFDGTAREIRSAMVQRHLLRRGWDAIAARGGRSLLTDNVHLSERAAREVAGLVRSFVEKADAGSAAEGVDR